MELVTRTANLFVDTAYVLLADPFFIHLNTQQQHTHTLSVSVDSHVLFHVCMHPLSTLLFGTS
jgi:hypothetical protein